VRRLLPAAAVALAAAVAPGPARPAPPPLDPVVGHGSCLVQAPARRAGCLTVRALHARGEAISPDGRWLVTFGGFDDRSALRLVRRDLRTGLLTPLGGRRGCMRLYWAAVRCAPMRLNKPTSLVFASDALDLYATAYCCAHVFGGFRLDGTTGALATLCCHSGPRGVAVGFDAAVSPDGRNVYVAGALGAGHGLAVLARDPAAGRVHQLPGEAGCVQRIASDGCGLAPSDSFAPERVVVAPDGRSVYVLSHGEVYGFDRDAATGALTPAACLSAENPLCGPLPVVADAYDLGVSPDGRFLYVVGNDGLFTGRDALAKGDALAVFARSRDGSLAPAGCIVAPGSPAPCRTAAGLAGGGGTGAGWGPGRALAFAPDLRALYLARSPLASGPSSVTVFARDLRTGSLVQAGEVVVAADEVSATPSPDGRFVYVGSGTGVEGPDAVRVYRVTHRAARRPRRPSAATAARRAATRRAPRRRTRGRAPGRAGGPRAARPRGTPRTRRRPPSRRRPRPAAASPGRPPPRPRTARHPPRRT
jgi:DNA-binding beta-propeller fold protein YncE